MIFILNVNYFEIEKNILQNIYFRKIPVKQDTT